MNTPALLFYSLLAAALVSGVVPRAAAQQQGLEPSPGAAKQAPDPRLGWLLLPQVRFRDATFDMSLDYFRRTAERQSGGVLKLTFVQELPKDFQPRHELTLDLKEIPFVVALNYLGELAGVQFVIKGATVLVQTESATALPLPLRQGGRSPLDAPPRAEGLSGPLAKPAEPTVAGDHVHRTTAGTIQTEKSGYVPRRSMGGWSTTQDPVNLMPVNCPHFPPCKGPLCDRPAEAQAGAAKSPP